jgi:hypothetical protein
MAKSDVLSTDLAVRTFCDEVRNLSGQEYKHLAVAAQELRAALAPYGRVRAWIVAAHFALAANAAKAASAHAVATYMSFLKHFEPEITAAKTKKSDKSKAGDGFRFGA